LTVREQSVGFGEKNERRRSMGSFYLLRESGATFRQEELYQREYNL